MDIDPHGNVYFGAHARDTIYFKHYTEEFMYAAQGNYDQFLAKYSSNGDMEWIKTMGSQKGYTVFTAVAATDTNKIFATGYFNNYLSVGNNEFYAGNYNSYVGRIGKESEGTLYIQGHVLDINGDSITAGTVELYEYMESGQFNMIKSLDLNGSSHYKLDSLSPIKYVVRVNPKASEYPSLAPAYYGDAVFWENASIIDIESTGSLDTADIILESQTEQTGNATISGYLTDKDQNSPVSNATVLLTDNSNAKAVLNMSRFTITGSDGMFQFENIEIGDYSIIIDIPGISMEDQKTVQVQTDQVEYLNNNYMKDSLSIFTVKAYISGNVNDAGGSPLTSGFVKIFDYDGTGLLPLVDSIDIVNGSFMSNNIPTSNYLIKAYPDPVEYPDYVSTYYEQTFSWEEATPIDVGAFDTINITLSPILIEEPSGNATIEGMEKA
jgi:hypothetical protein